MKVANEQRKKLKGKRGITLIALVITIIVLLILAGISIMMLTGDNSILNQATNAKNNTIEGQEKEAINVAYHGVLTENLGIPENFPDELRNQFNRNGEKVTVSSDGKKITFTDTQHVYTLDIAKGTITGPTDPNAGPTLLEMVQAGKACTAENCSDETHVHIGDFVNYTPSNPNATATVGESETGYSNSQTYAVASDTQWRVLGTSEDGEHVLLTTESPIKKSQENGATTNDPYLVLQGAAGYKYCKTTLNKICSIYANNSLGTIGSITMEDINAALGVTVTYLNNDSTKKPTKVAIGDGNNIDMFGGFAATYTYRGGYAPENYLEITAETKYIDDEIDLNAYGYMASSISDGTAKDIVFKGTDSGDYAKAYWVASPDVTVGRNGALFGPGLVNHGFAACGVGGIFDSSGSWSAKGFAVHPVVSLNSEVRLEEVGGINEDGEEITWTVPDGVIGPGNDRGSGSLSGDKGKVTARPQP